MAPPADEQIFTDVMNALVTHGKLTGKCDVVRVGEFKSPPSGGLTMAFWYAKIGSGIGSGLDATNARARITARLYYPALAMPEGACETKVAAGAVAFLRRLNGDLSLGGLIRNIDILGEGGEVAEWTWGYLTIDQKMSRVADLQIECEINDVWPQDYS